MGKGRLEAFSDGVLAIVIDWKARFSSGLYITAIPTLVAPWIAEAIFVAVALIWVIPDRRIEIALRQRGLVADE